MIKLVSALIWPVIVVVLALLFREPITGLLKRLKSIEAPGFKGAFNEPAEQALDKADAIAPQAFDPATQALIDQTASHPWWAVHQSWRSVRWAAVQATPDLEGEPTTPDRVQHLVKQGRAGEDLLQLTVTLRGLYYDMKAEPQLLTSTAAADFVEATSRLAQAIRVIADSTSDDAEPGYIYGPPASDGEETETAYPYSRPSAGDGGTGRAPQRRPARRSAQTP